MNEIRVAAASRPGFGNVASALPDALSALTFLVCWLVPSWLGYDWIKTLMLVMLIEFIVIHSSGFLLTMVYGDASRAAKTKALVAIGAFYLIFVGAFCLAFSALWPLIAFGWLLMSKFVVVWFDRKPDLAERHRQIDLWALSVAAYLGFVFATTLLPIPALGIDATARAAAAIPGTGAWVDEPQRVIVFGFLYFGTLALVKAGTWRVPAVLRTPKPMPPTGP